MTTQPTNDAWFFRYYLQRLANLQRLAEVRPATVADFPGSFDPDRLILAVAGLDSLAYHWDRVYGAGTRSHGERLGEFLVEHGDATVFAKCSMPELLTRALADRRQTLVDALVRVPNATNPPATQRRWQEDPTLRDLLATSAIAGAVDPDWVRRSRYGEILYKKFRCSWVHEFDGPGTGPPLFDVSPDEPRYDNRNGERELIFPLSFLLKTYETAIESFAAKCRADGKTP